MPDRRELRQTFDTAAARYQQARPRYPDDLFDSLEELSGLTPPVDVLEVGPATGIATAELARRFGPVVAIELGAGLAALASANFANVPAVEIVQGDVETWEPPAWGAFDLVVAATAWHWLDPGRRYELAHRHLRPGGVLAFWSATHVFPDGGDPFFREIQEVYDEIGEGLPPGAVFPRPGELADERGGIAASGRFEVVGVRHFDWETVHDAESYIDVLETFSGHIAMGRWQRDRLYGEIRRRLAARPHGTLRRHWGAVLHVARARVL